MAAPNQLDRLSKAWHDMQRAVNTTLPSLKRRAHAVYLHSLSNPATRGK